MKMEICLATIQMKNSWNSNDKSFAPPDSCECIVVKNMNPDPNTWLNDILFYPFVESYLNQSMKINNIIYLRCIQILNNIC